MKLDLEQVKKFLPHRDPFLFIDSVESLEYPKAPQFEASAVIGAKDVEGALISAHFYVREDLDIFRGHFPGNPILPGVIQIEIMAQASAFLVFGCMENPYKGDLEVALLKVEEAKFRKPIRPGTHLKIEVVCNKVRYPMVTQTCKIITAEGVMSEATLLSSAHFKK